jgi:hypothetical protein
MYTRIKYPRMWMHRNLTSYLGIDTYRAWMPVEVSTSAVAGSEGVVPSFSPFSLPAGNSHVAVCSAKHICLCHCGMRSARAAPYVESYCSPPAWVAVGGCCLLVQHTCRIRAAPRAIVIVSARRRSTRGGARCVQRLSACQTARRAHEAIFKSKPRRHVRTWRPSRTRRMGAL